MKKIKVLGSGCPNCKRLFELVQQAVSDLDLKTELEYVTDISKIIELGIMSTPALVIDNKLVLAGSLPDLKKIKEIISSY